MVEYFEKVWIGREGPENISIDWSLFGKPFTANYNSEIKTKFKQPEAKCSFYYFIELLRSEEETHAKLYFELTPTDKVKINTSR